MHKLTPVISAAAIAFVGFLTWSVSGIALLGDDWGHVRLAEQGLSSIWSTSWVGDRGVGGYYRPVTETSIYLNQFLLGDGSASLHLGNLGLHVLSAGLVYLVAARLFGDRDLRAAGAAVLFLVLPVHASAVFWVVGRGDVLCAVFYLAALLMLPRQSENSVLRVMGIGVFSLLAFLSKEMAFTLPLALALMAWHENTLQSRVVRSGITASLVMLTVVGLMRWSVLGSIDGGVGSPHLTTAIYDVLRAAGLFGFAGTKIAGPILMVLTVGLLVWLKVEARVLLPVVLLASIVLLPALGRLHRWYLYLPAVFFCIAVSCVWLTRGRGYAVRASAFGLLVACYGVVQAQASFDWRLGGRISTAYLDATADAVRGAEGRAFLLNVPSSLAGVPLFAHNLVPALASLGVDSERIEVVNHFWLDEPDGGVAIDRINLDTFLLTASRSRFSFHRGEDPSRGANGLESQTIDYEWGSVSVRSGTQIEVRLDALTKDDVVLGFDGSTYKAYLPDTL